MTPRPRPFHSLALALLLIGCWGAATNHFSTSAPLEVSATPLFQGVTRGGEDEVIGSITRSGAFVGDVTVDIEDASGAIHASETVLAADSSFDVTFEIPTDAALGATNWQVMASGSGVASATKTFGLTIGQAAGPIITWKNCDSSAQMLWAGSSNGTRPFVQRTVSNQTFSFAADSPKVSLAYTLDLGGGSFKTKIVQDLASALVTRGMTSCMTTSRITLSGSLANASPGDSSTVTIGPVHVDVPGPAGAGGTVPFTLSGVPSGTHTVVASRRMSNGVPAAFYLRRNYVPSPSTSLVVDFLSSFRQAPVSAALVLANLLGGLASVSSDFWPAGESDAAPLACFAPAAQSTYPIYGFPPSAVGSMDLHRISATVKGSADFRGITVYMNRLADVTATFPNPITFGLTCLAGTTPVRIQVNGTVQAGLADYFTTRMTQTVSGMTRSIWLNVSGAFTGATPGAPYTFALPDFSRAAYRGTDWGLLQGTDIKFVHEAIGSNLGGGASWGPPVNGLTVSEASHTLTRQCP